MRTILLHYFCEPPYKISDWIIGRHPYIPESVFLENKREFQFAPIIKGAEEDRGYLEVSLRGGSFIIPSKFLSKSLIETAFGSLEEYSANFARFLHCGSELLVKHVHYTYPHFLKYEAKVLPIGSLDVFKIIAADHGLSVEVRSILDLYKPVQETMEKELREELAKKV